eukprot:CAMPEP_0185768532 /NCGR_PEP_ID=MMETSP1174-20130828/50248_1 /TAXON_ID=35687 /ORGANISM="Dictyocha speculum, Strain CCMP1381" /LENGTH=69 /DNA_ID=CAMNT_0028453253 /DNA_START=141 /DNA_END=347 /DNA_ORIENTATION=-
MVWPDTKLDASMQRKATTDADSSAEGRRPRPLASGVIRRTLSRAVGSSRTAASSMGVHVIQGATQLTLM